MRKLLTLIFCLHVCLITGQTSPLDWADYYYVNGNYSKAIKVMLNRDREVIEKQAKELGLSDEQKNEQLAKFYNQKEIEQSEDIKKNNEN